MEFTDQVLATPAGGTIAFDGSALPTTGYFVGGIVSPLIITEQDNPAERHHMLDAFVSYLRGLTDVTVPFLGWWTDDETGHLWVDGTTWHGSEFEAGRIGRGRREIAIFDIAGERELRLAYVEGE